MSRNSVAFAFALAAFAAAGCGTPDNQILGGVLGNAQTVNAIIPDVYSAISGVVTLKDSSGNPAPFSLMILSERHDLCNSIKTHPDYFKNPPEGFVALILTAPADRLGSFNIGATNGGSATLTATAGPGFGGNSYPAVGGVISLRQFDVNGQAQGSFDVLVVHQVQTGHEVLGNFKTNWCAALGQAQFL